MDSAPFEDWEDAAVRAQEFGEGYFTFGPGGNFGSILLTILGIILMVGVVAAFMWTENHRLCEYVERRTNGSNDTSKES